MSEKPLSKQNSTNYTNVFPLSQSIDNGIMFRQEVYIITMVTLVYMELPSHLHEQIILAFNKNIIILKTIFILIIEYMYSNLHVNKRWGDSSLNSCIGQI